MNHHIWLVLADLHRIRLLKASRTPLGTWHLDEIEKLDTDWVPYEKCRPSPLSGKGTQAYAATEPLVLEELRHFARIAAHWIEEKRRNTHPDAMQVVAPARLLGALRKEIPTRLQESLHMSVGELAHLELSKLSGHPAVLKRLQEGEAKP